MQPIEIVVIVLCMAFVIGICIWAFCRKKKGKSVCGCGECNGDCAKCKAAIQKAKENKQKQNIDD